MTWVLPHTDEYLKFVAEVEELSGEKSADCYQCGKCTAGCPTAFAMDYPPNQILRAIQLGMRDTVLASKAIWLCASCETCGTRCPQEVDFARVADALRSMAYAEGIKSPEGDIPLFHRIFLGNVKRFGRQFEMAMAALYNLLSGHFVKDLLMAPKLLLKGKLPLLPSTAGRRGMAELFARVQQAEAEERSRIAALQPRVPGSGSGHPEPC
jgi:heterodisulfide reductase subunit C